MNQTTKTLILDAGHTLTSYALKQVGDAIRKAWDKQYPDIKPAKVYQVEPTGAYLVNSWPDHFQPRALEIIGTYYARKRSTKRKRTPRKRIERVRV